MDGKFATMDGNLFNAINASNGPPIPPGTPGSAGDVRPSFSVAAATARYDALAGGSVAPTQPWVDDDTTPHFS